MHIYRDEARGVTARTPITMLPYAGVNRIRFEGTLSARSPFGAEHP
jgi:hypothetical protein